MSRHTPEQDDFDLLLGGLRGNSADDVPEFREPTRRSANRARVSGIRTAFRRRWPLWVSGGAIVMGVAVMASAIVLPTSTPPAVANSAAPTATRYTSPVRGTVPPAPSGIVARLSIADRPDPQWARTTAEAAGIPERAFLAYAGAAIVMTERNPDCHIGWNTIAAIGLVESDHGRIDGGSIDSRGMTSPPIYGPALDGTEHDAIPDTEGGLWDSDPVWDRAMGPMQFVPSTWAVSGVSGAGNPVPNPQNIDDAAMSVASHLCDLGGDLSVSANWLDAIWAYNGTDAYVLAVSEAANRYARFS